MNGKIDDFVWANAEVGLARRCSRFATHTSNMEYPNIVA
jgi:hypothetical protein